MTYSIPELKFILEIYLKIKSYKKCVNYSLKTKWQSFSTTVANFSPEHSGTEKDQRGYPLCLNPKFLFLL
jgi:hypothetical protein